ncbi:succinylglutamate desuccinylase/aspartoacylase family protein [Celerinatantimonas diazotrophica]|uniref:Succinylglutamate desuccinylase/Aspartoacylase catalytic domain-containing protein n=1 Tax=Celerinatantimonas diazotrophica TaxID=412034 RepID=A0A4R1KE09_9GAMM|nr:succinylglutamate desuccinylase/aspartoacylase family protein [Celerinatantimonas diazotrophica]TCK61489.1 hypothetical protein EV690_0487 [Celerinatantimonas diazotrophica]CAG9296952.1 hypothetical protein CEDIAZO_02114 [Celerinatantimonas diazotrophica]
MHHCQHLLTPQTLGISRSISSFHFGSDHEKKVYIQGSLHADELPGMVVTWYLKQKLKLLEEQGRLKASITLVPIANPIGLGQFVHGTQMGRFEQESGQDFNRDYPMFGPLLAKQLESELTANAKENTQRIRQALADQLNALNPTTELKSLKIELLKLAYDAELMLDLHCDWEASAHLYTVPSAWPEIEPLARYLGTKAQLLADISGGEPFDEACYEPWYYLRQHLGLRFPIELGLKPVTLELRGVRDVNAKQAQKDADAIINYLIYCGYIEGDQSPLPELLYPATPLAGCEYINAPVSGVLLHHCQVGEVVSQGQLLAEILNPLNDELTPLYASVDGMYYARHWQRFATAGMLVARIASSEANRIGNLLVP